MAFLEIHYLLITDKTYEFLFTKPRTRVYILSVKSLCGAIYVGMFSLVNYLGFVFIISPLDTSVDAMRLFLISAGAAYIVSLIFFCNIDFHIIFS